jgi:transcriptional regulator GlxA family with amidase domain
MVETLECSPRTVSRVWQTLVGIPPRAYTKLMRFHRALKWIDEGRPLAWVAAQCGYADQAHMARQIREIAGLAPSRLRARLGERAYQDLYLRRESAPWKESI